jgi:hypothetical protein
VFRNLKDALHRFGDDMIPVTLAVRKQLSLVIKAGVRIDPDYLWEAVEPKIRAALLGAFSFEAQDLGAPVFLSQALRAIQGVKGVVFADVDVFDVLSADALRLGPEAGAAPADVLKEARPRISLASDEIAYLPPQAPETLILQELSS